jgi:hypothetical protein
VRAVKGNTFCGGKGTGDHPLFDFVRKIKYRVKRQAGKWLRYLVVMLVCVVPKGVWGLEARVVYNETNANQRATIGSILEYVSICHVAAQKNIYFFGHDIRDLICAKYSFLVRSSANERCSRTDNAFGEKARLGRREWSEPMNSVSRNLHQNDASASVEGWRIAGILHKQGKFPRDCVARVVANLENPIFARADICPLRNQQRILGNVCGLSCGIGGYASGFVGANYEAKLYESDRTDHSSKQRQDERIERDRIVERSVPNPLPEGFGYLVLGSALLGALIVLVFFLCFLKWRK